MTKNLYPDGEPYDNKNYPRMELIWADGGYAGKFVQWVKETLGYKLE